MVKCKEADVESTAVAGFHALGFNVIISFLAMCFINIAFSFSTLDVSTNATLYDVLLDKPEHF